MDKGFQEPVPNVPSVPTKKESPCVLSGKVDDPDTSQINKSQIKKSAARTNATLLKGLSDRNVPIFVPMTEKQKHQTK
ncbi:hypothetical protein [Nitrosomonas communis]|uniref:hypothetical protein n=1 Tax=Nitrosomonas communis TaxID=44574 RepID=UPI0026ED5671|nr:hypothetical protein [Nitrosomonas communis]MCO6428662.1 hypothetical protein [Nitrosomonas communis]